YGLRRRSHVDALGAALRGLDAGPAGEERRGHALSPGPRRLRGMAGEAHRGALLDDVHRISLRPRGARRHGGLRPGDRHRLLRGEWAGYIAMAGEAAHRQW